jgi:uncharacterized protein
MSLVLHTYRLQQIDTRLDQIDARLNAIQAILENNEEIRALRKKMEQDEASLQNAARHLRESEHNTQQQRIKIEQTESSLYSGAVKNPKELQDLQKDLESLKRHLATLEERELEAMLANDDATQAHSASQNALNAALAHSAQENAQLNGERVSLLQERDTLQAQRTAVLGNLDSATQTLYETIRTKRRGLAVASMEDGTCVACGATITLAMQQSARQNIVHCPTCGRILYGN